jgi:subtilisin family serine protease
VGPEDGWPQTRDSGVRAPVVVTLDTGLGRHPWFPDGPTVERDPRVDGRPIGLRFAPGEDAEVDGSTLGLVNGGLDPLAGHGTFIAGLIRQHCPSAVIVSAPVMYGDGVADEVDVVEALTSLWLRQRLATAPGGNADDAIDVITLSLGYHHERGAQVNDEEALFRVLRALSEAGVVIVAGSGNDASEAEFMPAAYAARVTGAPMVSVGALNPDGQTVAVYSNTGDWVQTYRPATHVVSTMPTTFDSTTRGDLLAAPDGLPRRGTPDPDDFSGGFGLWSGTSFAAPALAGQVAAAMCREGAKAGDPVERATHAVTDALGEAR